MIGPSPPTPWSEETREPSIADTAHVHELAAVIGAVTIGEYVMVNPFASVRGDEGMPIHVGDKSNVQDGVVLHALETIDEDENPVNPVEVAGEDYAIHVGSRVSLAHQSQVHGPGRVGDNSFIGMQAFVFKAKIGENCVLEPGSKAIGVEIPDERYVPAGEIISSQEAADALPEITSDYPMRALNDGVVHVNTELARGYNLLE